MEELFITAWIVLRIPYCSEGNIWKILIFSEQQGITVPAPA